MPASLFKPLGISELEALAKRGSVLGGEIGIAKLRRLAEAVESPDGSVRVSLHFRQHGGDWPVCPIIGMEYAASLFLVCQRCLEEVACPIEGSVQLAVLESPALAERLPEGVEPLILEGERLIPAILIEDEILLSMPLVPRHEPGSCKNQIRQSDI